MSPRSLIDNVDWDKYHGKSWIPDDLGELEDVIRTVGRRGCDVGIVDDLIMLGALHQWMWEHHIGGDHAAKGVVKLKEFTDKLKKDCECLSAGMLEAMKLVKGKR